MYVIFFHVFTGCGFIKKSNKEVNEFVSHDIQDKEFTNWELDTFNINLILIVMMYL